MKKFGLSAALCALSAFGAEGPSLTGQWSVHNSIAGNESDQTCKFVQTGGALSGTCKTDGGDVQVSGGVDGKKVTWKYSSDYNGTALTIVYTATLTGADTISGSVDVEPLGVSGDFTAKPLKEK